MQNFHAKSIKPLKASVYGSFTQFSPPETALGC
jgi:hypothetical protein